jgi:hypothetical protein
MPIHFHYVAELNCLFTTGKGKVSRQAFLDYHRAIDITDPPATLLVLSDYRELDPSGLSSSDIEEIRTNALGRTENKYQAVKEAIVVSETLTFGLSRMYDSVVYSEKYEVNVFTDMDEARTWLGLEPESGTRGRAGRDDTDRTEGNPLPST